MSLRRFAAAMLVFAAMLCTATGAWAARTFTYTQSPVIGTEFDMGSSQSITYTITNTASGGNAGERIYRLRFRINNGSLFAASTAAPAGWTRTAFSTTSVTFQANSWASAIASGGSLAFPINFTMASTTADVNQTLQDIRASFTNSTAGPPFTNLQNITTGNPGGWILRSLQVVSFVITDLSGNPVTAIVAGSSFRLVMTIKNLTTATQTTITSNPNPPTPNKTGTVTQTLTSTTGSPLSLAPGATGTITFTYSTNVNDSGTIYFTATARNGATVTSRLATSSVLAVGRFTAALTNSLSCGYAGTNMTVTMTLTDGFPYSILNVTPTLTPQAGAAATYISGPSPAAPIANVPPSPPTTPVTWTYQLNSTGTTNPFNFTGSATGTANTGGNPPVTTPLATSASVTVGNFTASISPTIVNAGSTNVEMTVSVTNNGCAPVNSVAITPGAGFSAGADAYSLVTIAGGASIETWSAGGTTFTSPDVASQMPLGSGGNFAIVMTSTPAAAGSTTFTIRVTDANGLFLDIPLTVSVNPFKSGTLNAAVTKYWREDFK